MISIGILRLPHGEGLEMPAYQTLGSAGMDVRAATGLVLEVGQTALIPTGFALELPDDIEAQLRPRSGLALRFGLTMLNSPATIDPDYRGEVGVILTNLGSAPFEVRRGERIAQMVFARFERVQLEEVETLGETPRSKGGFGSTGR